MYKLHDFKLHYTVIYVFKMYACFHRYYDIDKSVQLVCKYLHAYDCRSNVKIGINKLYDDASKSLATFII